MSDTSEHSILCGYCHAPVRRRAEGEADGEIGCADCGNWAGRDEVIHIAKQHLADKAKQSVVGGLRDALRGSKHLKFTSKPTPKRQYRFITDGQI